MAKAMVTNSKTPIAKVGARFCAALFPRTAPHIGITASPIANTKAIMRARCPSSGIMAGTAQRSVAYSLRALRQPRGAYNFRRASPAPASRSTHLARQADPQQRCPLPPRINLAGYRYNGWQPTLGSPSPKRSCRAHHCCVQCCNQNLLNTNTCQKSRIPF